MGSEWDKVEEWKTRIRHEQGIPDEYEIAIGVTIQQGRGIKRISPLEYMESAETNNRFMLSKDGEWFDWDNGTIFPAVSRQQHVRNTPSDLVNVDEFTQEHSDVLAHFVQVVGVLSNSHWWREAIPKMEFRTAIPGDPKTYANLPSLDDTTCALIYMRQLVSDTRWDKLLERVCDLYVTFWESPSKEHVEVQKDRVQALLSSSPSKVDLHSHVSTNLEFFEAFWYGAKIVHTNSRDSTPKEAYKSMYLDRHRKEEYLFELHMLMTQILTIASDISIMIQKDFGRWIAEGTVPAPDIFWLQQMFSWEPLEKGGEDGE